MTLQTTTFDPARVRRARIAVSAFFLTNGALYANLLPRLPEVKEAFGLSNTLYGFLVVAFPLGAILVGALPARAIRRFGSGHVAALGTVLLAVCLAAAGAGAGLGAGTQAGVVVFLAAMFLGGALDAHVDTAQNAQGMEVQRARGRSVINSLHALWSLGAVLGGLMGAAALALGVPLGWHLPVSGLVWSVVALVALRSALTPAEGTALRTVADPAEPEPGDPAGTAPERRRAGAGHRSAGRIVVVSLLPVALIAMAGVMVEDAGMNWSAVYLNAELGAPLATAGLGLVALMAAQFVGRVLGDPLTDRWGRVAVARAGAALSALSLLLVVLAPVPAVAVAGFAVAGFGCATLVPAAFHAADDIPGLRTGTGLALVSWLMRISFLSLSPAIGMLSDAVGLRAALVVVPVFALVAALTAGVLRDGSAASPRN
ncbi:MFS transporter [Kocuria sp. SM24M-10]|uniref:MFS transporter n=1 Tax=Kocuria sp. SM24M-10 TaxID=1660349 RepID=UPI0006499AD2|nr:MFS transporter [Kocuria sp. SM24M-10]KLU08258.1 fucose permease [Kocuria sp. SM24M-10]